MAQILGLALLLAQFAILVAAAPDETMCEAVTGSAPDCWKDRPTRVSGDSDEDDDDDDDDDAVGLLPLEQRFPAPGPEPIKSEGCGKTSRWPAGAVTPIVMPLDDPNLIDPYREFYVYLPKGYNNQVPLPVIYSFHGYYSSAQLAMHDDNFIWKLEKDLAKKHKQGFVLVYGQGMADCGKPHCYDEPWPQRTWNVWGATESPGPRGPTCNQNRYRFGRYGCYTSCRIKAGDPTPKACNAHDHCHSASCVNETLYADTLMNMVENKLCVDKRRQYVTGMSNGGMMAYWMASHFADRFAAAIPVAGSALLGFWQDPRMEIPLMDIHGTLDKTIPANYSNGFIGLGPHSTGKPMVVPNCCDCAFSDDGFYYMPNYNITRGVAMSNNCSCTRYGAQCTVKPWPTMMDGTKVAKNFGWTCFQSFGDCGSNPIVRCTWTGKHFRPVHGKLAGNQTGIHKAKRHFFADVAWEFFSQFSIPKGSRKEALLLERMGSQSMLEQSSSIV